MTPEWLIEYAITPAMRLLDAKMDSPAARAMLIAIALQETRLQTRHQKGGPAHSYWQFEIGGVKAVIDSYPLEVSNALDFLDYPPEAKAQDLYAAIEFDNVLDAVLARLLLRSIPQKLPAQNAPGKGWAQYLAAWRPGKPHRATWDGNYAEGWEIVTATA